MTREEALQLTVEALYPGAHKTAPFTKAEERVASAILTAVAEERERCLSHCQPMDTKHDGDMYWLGYTTARLEAERREATAIKAREPQPPSEPSEAEIDAAVKAIAGVAALNSGCIEVIARAALAAAAKVSADRLRRIREWCDAYPIEAFPEPDLAAARAKLGDDVFSALHASWARAIVKGIAEERERCAKIARHYDYDGWGHANPAVSFNTAQNIADIISGRLPDRQPEERA